MSFALPSRLVRQKLTALGWRVALARRLNRMAVWLITLIALHLGCFALAIWPGLPVLGLRIALALFTATAAALAIGMLRHRRRADDRTLAALFEQRFPQLGELLLTSVALSDAAAASPFVAQIRDATDRHVAPLNPGDVVSLRRPLRRALMAGAVLLGTIVLFIAAPRYARFCNRFFGAWSDAAIGYHLEVLPGDGFAARGRVATVEVRLLHDDPDVPLPADCFLVLHQDGGAPQRAPMDASGDGFFYSWPRFGDDVTYHVEAGDIVAGPFRLRAVDPIELAAPPEARLTPPPYVNAEHLPTRTLTNAGPFTAIQFSSARLALRFTRQPARVTLQLREASGGAAVLERAVQCEGNGAAVELPTHHCGTFAATLRIEADHGIVTTHALAGWRVTPDAPPHFAEPMHLRGVRERTLYGKDQRIATDDPLRVQAVVEDAEGLAALALEYRVNNGPTVAMSWADGAGRLRVAIDRALTLPKGLRAGDRVRIRLRATDNRALARDALGAGVPPESLVPQVVYSPADERWVELTVGKPGESLLRQEIADQHSELDRHLEQVRQKLQKEHELLGQVRLASHQRSAVSPAQLQQLAEAGRLNQAAAGVLDDLAAKLADVPELAPLGDHLLAIAESELAQAAQAMAQFQRPERTDGDRENDVQAGEAAVLAAMRKLNGLASLAERLAQGRLDRLEMERLAVQEQELARRIEELLAANNADEAALAELRAEQDRIAARLQELGQKSETLRDALAQAEAKRLADHAALAAKELMKAGPAGAGAAGAGGEKKLLDEMKQLAEQTLKLAQQAGTDQMKKIAQESAQATEAARQAMDKRLSDKAQGKPAEAKAMQAEALAKLELAQKGLQGMGDANGDAKMRVAQALAESQKMMQAAQRKLQARPAQAPKAMRQAAGALDRAAQQMNQQLGQALPRLAGRPATGAGGMGKGPRLKLPAAFAKKLEPFQGKAWGELPGELKTQLLQDARTRFGDDYAPIIQHYFEQIAAPDSPRKIAPGQQP